MVNGTPTAQFLQTNQTSQSMKTLEVKTKIAEKNNLYSNHLINIFQYQYQALQLYKSGERKRKTSTTNSYLSSFELYDPTFDTLRKW
tara:strand:+ start:509 stop:769 length:261 start_codon:yes stop_codon:yes gene_type:complete